MEYRLKSGDVLPIPSRSCHECYGFPLTNACWLFLDGPSEMKQSLALAPEAANARAVQDRIYMWQAELAKKK